MAAIAGRTVHAYHVEGTGGGHVPDLLGLVREPSILCSSTTPTIPFGVHTAVEHVPMTMLNHGLSWAIPDDVALVRERVLEARMAAEARSTSWARSRSSTPTRRAWAASRRCAGRSSSPTS